jgi:hypothetical protein
VFKTEWLIDPSGVEAAQRAKVRARKKRTAKSS